MSYAKGLHSEYPQFDGETRYWTERSICYALEENHIKFGEDFELHKKIDNVPFNKTKVHEVDFVLTSSFGEKLYVEVKGLMTYLEVNKLRYLLESEYDFYIFQLTEIDWMGPYTGETAKDFFMKSKKDFEDQINELVKFVRGELKGADMVRRSKERLDNYIAYRNKDIETWNSL